VSTIEFSRFVEDLATASGKAILPFFRARFGMEDKSGGAVFDPVTEADRAGEAIMRRMIADQFPLHGILGEEFGTERGEAEYVWVLDPIDGTRAFISGIPVWGTLIGLTRNGAPAYGMMHQPFAGERFCGDGQSASYAGPTGARRLATRACESLSQATLMTTDPGLFEGERKAVYDRIAAQARLRRYGCDCYAYCMLAMGQIDIVIESGLKPYDIVALIPIIEGAGGVVTNWTGGPAAEGGDIIASGDRRLHDKVLTEMARYPI
jgi:histidinol phosphatase-like enzyme (inositol monophosphatase family)